LNVLNECYCHTKHMETVPYVGPVKREATFLPRNCSRHLISNMQQQSPAYCYSDKGRLLYSGRVIMAALRTRCGHDILQLWFLSFFFSSPNLSGRRLDVYHIFPHMTWPWCEIRMHVWNAEMCCMMRLAENTGRKNNAKKSPFGHYRTTLSSQLRHVSTIEKNSNISSTFPHYMVNFGPLTAEIGWRVWGIPANFNRFPVLASLLHRRRSKEVSQTLHGVWPSFALVHYTPWP